MVNFPIFVALMELLHVSFPYFIHSYKINKCLIAKKQLTNVLKANKINVNIAVAMTALHYSVKCGITNLPQVVRS